MIAQAGLKTPLHRNDWQSARFKFLYERKARPVRSDDGVVTAFRDGAVTLRSNRREDGFTFADKEIGYQGVEPGDLVIHAMDGFAGAIGISDSRGKCSPVYTIAVPKAEAAADTRFWAYYLRNLATTGFIESLAKGIRERSTDFRWKDAGNLLVNFPDRETQKAVADFLDRETARIDQLITKKTLLVELLIEKDKAVVKLHVLGQLGERDRIPSKAAWLPDLPSDWPVQRCAYIFRNLDHRRIPLNAEQRADLEKVYPYYGASGVIDHVDRYIFDGENILVGEDGANLVMQSTPIAFKASDKYWVNNHAHIIHPRFGHLDYWVHALNQVPYEIFVTGSAQPKLTSESLGNIRLPCPPTEEQIDIVRKLEEERGTFVALQTPINHSITRLREFRAALITATVTGQIDVATWSKKGHTDRQLDKLEDERSSLTVARTAS